MKKALSVLLVAAALFGFYGSAVTVNDLLACKDYWEEAGEKSTADMNKLEDGLNQLKDNEQAYLDGKDQIADGEQALADGEAQYEQGLADYAAAPGKLAAGERALADGEKSYKDLKKLIKGLQTARNHGVKSTKDHGKWWHDGFTKQLKPNREKIEGVVAAQAQLLGLIDMLNGQTPGTIVSRFSDTGQSYPSFDKKVVETQKDFENAANVLRNYKKSLFAIGTLATNTTKAATAYGTAAAIYQAAAQTYAGDPTEANKTAMDNAQADMVSAKGDYDTAKATLEGAAAQFDSPKAYGPLNDQLSGIAPADMKSAVTLLTTAIENCANGESDKKEIAGLDDEGKPIQAPSFGIIASALNGDGGATLKATIDKYVNMLDHEDEEDITKAGYAQQFAAWDDGYQTLYHAKDGKTSDEYPDDLASKSSGVPYAFKNMVTNKTIKAAIKKYDRSLMKELKKFKGDRLANDTMEEFDKDINYLGKKVIPRALKVLAKVKGSATKQLADGRKQLAQGRRDYAAAPGKLAEAEQMLADGRQALEDGKAQLAQYEDGEQQVRDGLAALTGTEPDLDLESIADRLNGDTDFDNGDEHLDLDEGLAAVDVGRGYQADDGVLITKEIMGRAVGTGGLIGAAVLAVLAAILSFLKKNKAAGVFAILAAAAGAFGAFYGPAQGTYFSDIAGSTIGATTWVAAGVLGAVALVHAIAHFAAPKAK